MMSLKQAKQVGIYVDALVNVRDLLETLKHGTRDAVRFANIADWNWLHDSGQEVGELQVPKDVGIAMLECAERDLVAKLKALGVKA